MEHAPLVSVLLPTYREPVGQFEIAIGSILGQTYENLEVLVVSDDPDNEELLRYANEMALRDPRIHVIANERNLGLVSSLNKAISLSSGDVICRMDADDISIHDRIENQLDYLFANDLDLVGGVVEVIDVSGDALYVLDKIPLSSVKVSRSLALTNCMPHPSWLGRRKVFELGYRKIPYAEDYDLLLRALLQGFKLANIGKTVLKYRRSDSGISQSHLYDQFVVKRCLQKSFKKNQAVELSDVEECLSRFHNESKSARFKNADLLFNESLRDLGDGRFLSSVSKAVRIPFVSGFYCLKIFDMVRAASFKE